MVLGKTEYSNAVNARYTFDAYSGDLGWTNLTRQQQIQRTTLFYRFLHGLAPDYLFTKFEKRETV